MFEFSICWYRHFGATILCLVLAVAPVWSQCAENETTIEVIIEPDNYPNEISWELSHQGNIIASGAAEGAIICFDATIEG